MFTGLLAMLAAGVTGLAASSGKYGKILLGQTLSQGSIARKTHASRLEPITLIDSQLEMNERLDPALETCVAIYGALFSQAIALTNTTVNNTQIIKRLESLNPTNTSMRSLMVQLGLESIYAGDGRLSTFFDQGSEHEMPDLTEMLALENRRTGKIDVSLESNKDSDSGDKGKGGRPNALRSSLNSVFKDKPELAFGKVIDYELKQEGETFTIPVSIRLATSLVSSESIANAMMGRFKTDESALERKVKWDAGSINSLSELMFCTDLVRQAYKNMLKDKDGVYAKLTPEQSGKYSRALIRGEVSVAQASNIMVLSKQTADMIEARTGGSFANESFRQKMLEATGIMILVIIDPLHDVVLFYIESLAKGQRVAGRNLSSPSNKNGPDIQSILSVLTTGRGNLI